MPYNDQPKIRQAIEAARHVRPTTPRHLWNWVYPYSERQIPRPSGLCRPHGPLRPVRAAVPRAPVAGALARAARQRQELSLGHRNPSDQPLQRPARHADSGRLVVAIRANLRGASEKPCATAAGNTHQTPIRWIACSRVRFIYRNGSQVSLLAASPTSVRGPHVPSLKLDEVDEIDPDIRESAMGMAMEKHGCRVECLDDVDLASRGGPDGRADGAWSQRGVSRSTRSASSRRSRRCPDRAKRPQLREMSRVPDHDVVPRRTAIPIRWAAPRPNDRVAITRSTA